MILFECTEYLYFIERMAFQRKQVEVYTKHEHTHIDIPTKSNPECNVIALKTVHVYLLIYLFIVSLNAPVKAYFR